MGKAVVKLMSLRKAILGLILFGLIPAAYAVEISGINRAEVLVQTQSASERRAAMQDALAEVIIRISGMQSVLMEPGVATILLTPERFLQQYRYEDSEEMLLDEEGEPLDTRKLIFDFDENALLGELQREGLPVWGTNRPSVLVWWVERKLGQREILTVASESELPKLLAKEKIRRGVPFAYPLMDPQDSANVEISDIWGFFSSNVSAASERYNSQIQLLGKSYEITPGHWSLSWMLVLQGQEYWNEANGRDLPELMSIVVDDVADKLAQQFAVVMSGESEADLRIEVVGVEQLEDYAQLIAYLDGLVSVRQAIPVAAEYNRLSFTIMLNGELAQFEQALSLDKHLVQISGDPMVLEMDGLEVDGLQVDTPKSDNSLESAWPLQHEFNAEDPIGPADVPNSELSEESTSDSERVISDEEIDVAVSDPSLMPAAQEDSFAGLRKYYRWQR